MMLPRIQAVAAAVLDSAPFHGAGGNERFLAMSH